VVGEFRAFLLNGLFLALAIGVIIGAAFGKIVTSLVNDIIMPPIGLAVGNVDFKDLAYRIGTNPAGEPVLFKYGLFIQNVFEFLIIAFALFLMIKGINKLKRPPPPSAAVVIPPTREEQLLTEIRESAVCRMENGRRSPQSPRDWKRLSRTPPSRPAIEGFLF